MKNKYCMAKYSKLISNLPILSSEMLEEAFNNVYVETKEPYMYLTEANVMTNSSFFQNLKKNLCAAKVEFFKTKPFQLYDWHTDPRRGTAINWLVKAHPSAITLHRSNHNNRYYWDIEVVDYKLNMPTLFDIKQEHCVVNHTNEERIILSASLMCTFDEAYEYLTSLNIDTY